LDDLTFRFENHSSHSIELKDWEWGWGPGLGTSEPERKENARVIRALSLEKISVHRRKPGEYPLGQWSGIDNRYFLVAFIPVAVPGEPELVVSGTKEHTQVDVRSRVSVPAHGEIVYDYQLYAGPKGYTRLRTYGKKLEEAVDFG